MQVLPPRAQQPLRSNSRTAALAAPQPPPAPSDLYGHQVQLAGVARQHGGERDGGVGALKAHAPAQPQRLGPLVGAVHAGVADLQPQQVVPRQHPAATEWNGLGLGALALGCSQGSDWSAAAARASSCQAAPFAEWRKQAPEGLVPRSQL